MMIQIKEKSNCCGCQACGDVCPKQAIAFKIDQEGFWYPEVDRHLCVDCGLCERVCPCLNDKEPQRPFAVFAAVNPDEEVRMESSSGGVFWMLVKQTIEEGGVVFGAAFDEEWMVCHSSAETLTDAKKYRGSKYVQSRLSGCYMEAQRVLKQGRKVLFSGTACQIAGLKNYLNKDYPNLLNVDVVCHGVPSPGIWNDYIKLKSNNKDIRRIIFREKTSGWRNYDFLVDFSDGSNIRESHNRNLYMQGFLSDLYLRPACHNCKFKQGRCGSDMTLGDFWGIEKVFPNMDDNLGVSVVLVNSSRGESYLKKMDIIRKEVDYENAVKENPCIIKSTSKSKYRPLFMEKYQEGAELNIISEIMKRIRPSKIKRLVQKAKSVLLHK